MATSPNREAAVATLVAALHKQYPTKGFKIHPSLKFVQTEGSYGIDVQVTAPISKDEILVVVPESCPFCTSNIPSKDSVSGGIGKELYRLLQIVEAESEGIVASIATQHEYHVDGKEIALALLAMYVRCASDRKQTLFGDSVNSGCTWCEQAATWPSEEEMIRDSPLYWTEKERSILGRSFVRQHLESTVQQVKQVFDGAVLPILTKELHSTSSPFDITSFVLPSVEDRDLAGENEELWSSFLYGFSIVYSRCHEGSDGRPELIPIVDLLNGLSSVCSDDINVNFVRGKWPFIRGDLFQNECNLHCSALYAQADVAAGESLIISYGELTPSSFLVKYGALPYQHLVHANMTDSVNLWIPPSMVPDKETDNLRCIALEKAGYPLDEFRRGGMRLVFLPGDDDSSGNHVLARFVQGAELGFRQFFLLSRIADETAVQFNIMTGRVRCNFSSAELCHLLVILVDYNIELLTSSSTPSSSEFNGATSAADIERSNDTQLSSSEAAALLGRVCQRETLAKWRHAFCRRYECSSHVDVNRMVLMETPDALNNGHGGCRICGKTWPLLACSRCKWRGRQAAMYCSNVHQKCDWKNHKHECRAEGTIMVNND